MRELLPFAIMLCNGIGQLAIIAVLFGTLQRRRTGAVPKALLSATLFALCGLIAMSDPTIFPDGAVLDLRGVIVGLAGAFAGWPAALVAALATAAYRIHLGGIYVAGCASIALAAGLGLLWRWRSQGPRQTRTRRLLELGILLSFHPLPLLFVPATWSVHTLVPTLLTLFGASLAGALGFGKLLEREMGMIAQEQHLTRVALHDPLTNLLNRRGFESAFFEARSLERDAPLALLLIDIDHFKSVNDRYGHDVGDTVLRTVARELRASAGRLERTARHGGEEFAILLPRADAAEAVRRAEAVRCGIEALTIAGPSGTGSIRATVSVGVASCMDGCTAMVDLLRQADEALYRAKREGRNRSVLFDATAPTTTATTLREPAACAVSQGREAAAVPSLASRRRLASVR